VIAGLGFGVQGCATLTFAFRAVATGLAWLLLAINVACLGGIIWTAKLWRGDVRSRADKVLAGLAAGLGFLCAATITSGFSATPGALGRHNLPLLWSTLMPVAWVMVVLARTLASRLGVAMAGAVAAVLGLTWAVCLGELTHSATLPHVEPEQVALSWFGPDAARLPDGRVLTWGEHLSSPRFVAGIHDARFVAVGPRASCAVQADGHVLCWPYASLSPQAKPLTGVDDATQVVSHDGAVCVLHRSGAVSCLEIQPTNDDRSAPLKPVVGLKAKSLAAGRQFTCALRDDGHVACWGFSTEGVLGKLEKSDEPVLVPGLDDAIQLVADEENACALRKAGEVVCWGADHDLMPPGQHERDAAPVAIPKLGPATELAMGSDFGCVLRQGGEVWCWGGNNRGDLGRGTDSYDNREPSPVVGLPEPAEHLWLGGGTACARLHSGQVWCWGSSDHDDLPGESTVDCAHDHLGLTFSACVLKPQRLRLDN
jgi:hypothetical protein